MDEWEWFLTLECLGSGGYYDAHSLSVDLSYLLPPMAYLSIFQTKLGLIYELECKRMMRGEREKQCVLPSPMK